MTRVRVKRPSSAPRPSHPADAAEQLTSGTEASIDATLRELDSLELAAPKNAPGRRVPPFPGTGRTLALPLLPSIRPMRSSRPKKGG